MARWLVLQWRKLERVLARVLVVSQSHVVSNPWHIPSFNDSHASKLPYSYNRSPSVSPRSACSAITAVPPIPHIAPPSLRLQNCCRRPSNTCPNGVRVFSLRMIRQTAGSAELAHTACGPKPSQQSERIDERGVARPG